MKPIYKVMALAAAAVMFSSCNDFLDSENLTQKTTANFPANETEADEMLTGVYAKMLFSSPERESYYYMAQMAADECLGGNLSNSGNCAVNFLLYKDNLNGFAGLWSRCYALINRANTALGAYANVASWSSEAEENRHYGETYFLRALAYYELAQVFGGVPVRTTTEAINMPRNTVDEVYELIAADLKKAIELLPARNYIGTAMDGHANKYVAESYMARVFLFYTGRYGKTELPGGITKENVIAWINDVVSNSGHDLEADQRTIWPYSNDASRSDDGYSYKYADKYDLHWVGNGSKETVFANKYNMKSTWSYYQYSNSHAQYCSPSGDNAAIMPAESYPFSSGWGAGPVSPAFIKEWQSWAAQQQYTGGQTTDPRITGSVWSYKAYEPNNLDEVFDRRLDESEPDYTVSNRYYEQTGYFQKKYICINARLDGKFVPFCRVQFPGMSTQTSNSLVNSFDLIHMRFADVLLMQSELTSTADGLNRVRARSGLAPVAYSVEALRNERKYELAFESIRWFDLLRYAGPALTDAGALLNKQTGFTLINAGVEVQMVNYDYAKRLQATQGYWPIPQDEIDLSNGVLEQNPGWGVDAMYTDWTNL